VCARIRALQESRRFGPAFIEKAAPASTAIGRSGSGYFFLELDALLFEPELFDPPPFAEEPDLLFGDDLEPPPDAEPLRDPDFEAPPADFEADFDADFEPELEADLPPDFAFDPPPDFDDPDFEADLVPELEADLPPVFELELLDVPPVFFEPADDFEEPLPDDVLRDDDPREPPRPFDVRPTALAADTTAPVTAPVPASLRTSPATSFALSYIFSSVPLRCAIVLFSSFKESECSCTLYRAAALVCRIAYNPRCC
jgi:hypothetical protein